MPRLRTTVYTLSFLDEVGPFVTLYALWFANNGMSVQQVSFLFAVWAIVALVAEVPTGLLADGLDRRRVLAGGVVLRSLGIALLLVFPSMWGFTAGAALWAVQLAASSGTWEAVVHDGLSAQGDADSYETVMARSGQFNQAGIALGTAAAAGLLYAGVSLQALGWATVVLAGPVLALIAALPAASAADDIDDEELSFAAEIADGFRGLVRTRSLLWLVGLGAVLESVFVLDEYMPALAVAVNTPGPGIALLVLSLWLGLVGGGEVVARRPGMSNRTLAAFLVAGVLVGLVGLFWHHPLGACLLAVPYAAMNMAWLAMDARLQAQIADTSRATVGSARSFVGSLGNLLVFAGFGIVIPGADPTGGLVACLLIVAVLAIGIALGLRPDTPDPRPSRSR